MHFLPIVHKTYALPAYCTQDICTSCLLYTRHLYSLLPVCADVSHSPTRTGVCSQKLSPTQTAHHSIKNTVSSQMGTGGSTGGKNSKDREERTTSGPGSDDIQEGLPKKVLIYCMYICTYMLTYCTCAMLYMQVCTCSYNEIWFI